jgi:hypothetical protein
MDYSVRGAASKPPLSSSTAPYRTRSVVESDRDLFGLGVLAHVRERLVDCAVDEFFHDRGVAPDLASTSAPGRAALAVCSTGRRGAGARPVSRRIAGV